MLSDSLFPYTTRFRSKVFDLAMEFMRLFGYSEPVIYLSTRPERRLGTDEMWDKAENALRQALGVREVPYKIDEGGGVFYAPRSEEHTSELQSLMVISYAAFCCKKTKITLHKQYN